ncbi:hypothetical protein NL676_009163 [Syzygium grande]|nr:hypothetical protein NL676_009163 [Syzygium grande]
MMISRWDFAQLSSGWVRTAASWSSRDRMEVAMRDEDTGYEHRFVFGSLGVVVGELCAEQGLEQAVHRRGDG